MKTKLFNFNLPNELRTYLDNIVLTKYTNRSQYIIDLIVKDMEQTILNRQLISARPLSEDDMSQISGVYHSGKKMVIGDKILFGLLFEKINNSDYKLISYHQDEIGTLYRFHEKSRITDTLPKIIKIK